jgi:hypothetical protein
MEPSSPVNPASDVITALTAPILRQIRDEDGFTKSFSAEQTREYIEFFHQWGFVVIRNVLTPDVRILPHPTLLLVPILHR